MEAPIPANEEARLRALQTYAILDTLPELAYDDIAQLAAQICGCPAGLVTFLDEKRQWMKAKYGLPPELTQCPREITICQTTICNDDVLYVPDLSKDLRFGDLPLVSGEFHLRFYCGAPLITPDGYALGTICVIDFQPRELSFEQQEALRRLSRQTVAQLELRRKLLEQNEILRQLQAARETAESDRQNWERLLLNILPAAIADELKTRNQVEPRFFDSVTVLLADFVDFTRLTERLEPAGLVHELHEHFSKFDEIVASNRLEKMKTIGDAYLAIGGLPETNTTHPLDAALAALQIQAYLDKVNRQREQFRLPVWQVRIGINTGPVIAGVVGRHKFTYDAWGNAVNVAQRLEAADMPGRVNISAMTWHHVKRLFETEPRGSIEVKGKGQMPMYFLGRVKPEYAADSAGCKANAQFWAGAS
jgi:class 3 adenylate cyclase